MKSLILYFWINVIVAAVMVTLYYGYSWYSIKKIDRLPLKEWNLRVVKAENRKIVLSYVMGFMQFWFCLNTSYLAVNKIMGIETEIAKEAIDWYGLILLLAVGAEIGILILLAVKNIPVATVLATFTLLDMIVLLLAEIIWFARFDNGANIAIVIMLAGWFIFLSFNKGYIRKNSTDYSRAKNVRFEKFEMLLDRTMGKAFLDTSSEPRQVKTDYDKVIKQLEIMGLDAEKIRSDKISEDNLKVAMDHLVCKGYFKSIGEAIILFAKVLETVSEAYDEK